MLKNYVLWGALFGWSLVGAACYPGEIDSAAQTDLVVTFHQEGFDFQSNLTFKMPDTIIDISVAAGADTSLDHSYDTQILAKVEQSFEAIGYTRLDDTSSVEPDFVVLLSAVTVENYYYYSYPWWPYWGWWGGWYGPWGYGVNSTYYYPWYPVYTTNFTSGSLFITMVDPDAPPPEPDQAGAVWSAAFNGMLEGTNTEILARINSGISQAFLQSPYLTIQ
ncbi:MAG TPA: DUF4136 domain-containing protein [Gemmatimonadales bacterium]|nr:DUF4136 domain-containing protein [Gemmatimonadales bacterium]